MCYLLLNQDFLSVLDVDAWLRYLVDFAALEVEDNIYCESILCTVPVMVLKSPVSIKLILLRRGAPPSSS